MVRLRWFLYGVLILICMSQSGCGDKRHSKKVLSDVLASGNIFLAGVNGQKEDDVNQIESLLTDLSSLDVLVNGCGRSDEGSVSRRMYQVSIQVGKDPLNVYVCVDTNDISYWIRGHDAVCVDGKPAVESFLEEWEGVLSVYPSRSCHSQSEYTDERSM